MGRHAKTLAGLNIETPSPATCLSTSLCVVEGERGEISNSAK